MTRISHSDNDIANLIDRRQEIFRRPGHLLDTFRLRIIQKRADDSRGLDHQYAYYW
ncbi:MAG: hypothetical protein IPP25_11545 [Saprospiraceae bacterium]|nr:hypothetical protein [Candidatus Opimibacter skivensis]